MSARNQTLAIALAILLAILLGALAGDTLMPLFTWGGQFFIRLLKMVIVPLILSSLIAGVVGAGSSGGLGRLGLKTMAYYLLTSTLAILMGLLVFNLLDPGLGAAPPDAVMPQVQPATEATIPAILLRMVPDNIVDAMARTDTLAIIFFALLLRCGGQPAAGSDRHRIESLVSRLLLEVMLTITGWVLKPGPGRHFLSGRRGGGRSGTVPVQRPCALLHHRGHVPLGAHSLLTLPIMIRVIWRAYHPWRFGSAMGPAHADGLLHQLLERHPAGDTQLCRETGGHQQPHLLLRDPSGATINMDGTALYECGVALFIAQYYGIDLGLGQQVVLVFTCLLTSIAVAGIPMASIALIPVILAAVGPSGVRHRPGDRAGPVAGHVSHGGQRLVRRLRCRRGRRQRGRARSPRRITGLSSRIPAIRIPAPPVSPVYHRDRLASLRL
jgi:proton glutamate symport protein